MSFITASPFATERTSSNVSALSRVLKAAGAFVSAWVETSAAYTVYRELSGLSDTELATRGLERQDIARTAMGLPIQHRD